MKKKIGCILSRIPIVKNLQKVKQLLGIKMSVGARISSNITIIGDCSNITMSEHSEINSGCFIVAKAPIYIGENSTLAYQVGIFTSAYPNGPYNELCKIYDKVRKPITIGKNCWIGARAVILPGVTIGDYSVVAAGAIVTKDVPSGVVVAGCPAVVKKKLIDF